MKCVSCKKELEKKDKFTVQAIDSTQVANYFAVVCKKCGKINAEKIGAQDIKVCDICDNLPQGRKFERYKVTVGVLDPSKEKKYKQQYPKGAAFEGILCPKCRRLNIIKHIPGMDVSKQLSAK